MSTLKVNTIRHTGASSDAVTLATDGTCTAKITNNLSNRNLIINGAMLVAQRGTSSTADGCQTVDRIKLHTNSADEALTQEQVDVASGTTPYTLGFRKAYKLTNGNQTNGAGTGDYAIIRYRAEAQDIANCGWNYTSASSYITLSFWVKASVAQNYYFSILSSDGTLQNYPMETGSLTANTWTKITKTIPGGANVQFDNNNGIGIELDWWPFAGLDYTSTQDVTLNTWAAYSGGTRFPDHTSTWWTTNDATFEITGLQLEVGDVATDFEHRSYGDELARCQRYYQRSYGDFATSYSWKSGGYGRAAVNLCTMMRATPTVTATLTGGGGTMGTIVAGGFGTFYLTTSSLNEDQASVFSWTANAEL